VSRRANQQHIYCSSSIAARGSASRKKKPVFPFLKTPSGLLLFSTRGIFIAGSPLRAHDILLYSKGSGKNGKLNHEQYK